MSDVQQSEPILLTTSAEATWEKGMRTQIAVRQFDNITMDEPEALGGTDGGPNPMEFVIAALDGCVAVMINLIAGEMGFHFSDLLLKGKGVLDLRGLMGVPGVTRHFQSVILDVTLKTSESAERLGELQHKVHNRCPAINLLKDAGVPLHANWVAVPE